MITDLRRYLVGEAQLRGAPAASLQKAQRVGNPWGLSPQQRFQWAAGLKVPTVEDCPDFELLYWVGCAAAYDRRIQKVARSVVQLLHIAGVRFAVLGNQERCTGEWARRMGDEFLFQELVRQNIDTLNQHRVRQIVTHCPHCLNSFRNDCPEFGGHYEVIHHTQLLSRLLDEGRLPLDASSTALCRRTITYHDPCYLARVHGVTEAPRHLIESSLVASGGQLREMQQCGRQTSCCGAGGGRMWFDEEPSERVANHRVREALETGADTLAVSCPFCLTMFADTVAADSPQVQDLPTKMLSRTTGRWNHDPTACAWR
jgi:Fe-S oxidoreductase